MVTPKAPHGPNWWQSISLSAAAVVTAAGISAYLLEQHEKHPHPNALSKSESALVQRRFDDMFKFLQIEIGEIRREQGSIRAELAELRREIRDK